MAKLILIRHGRTDWDDENRIQGSLDIPLNHEGKREAQKISTELSETKIDAIYSSPAACSLSTALEIAVSHRIKVKKMNEFKELNHSVWQGLLHKTVKKRYKKQYKLWRTSPASGRPPNGESVGEAYDRAVSALHKLADRHGNETLCIVSHDVIFSVIKCYLKNIELEKIWDLAPGMASYETFEL